MKRFLILFTLIYSNICFSFTDFSIFKKKFNIAEIEALNKFDEGYVPIEEEGKKDFYISAGVGKLHFSNITTILDTMRGVSKELSITKDELDEIKNMHSNRYHSLNAKLSSTSISKTSHIFSSKRLKEILIKVIYEYNRGWKDILTVTENDMADMTVRFLGIFNNILDVPTKLNVDLRLISNISFGYCINDNLKFEIEAIITKININFKNDWDSFVCANFLIYSLIPNIYCDYKIQDLPLRLYLGMSLMPSISLVNINSTSDGHNHKDISTLFFTHQVKFGVDYALTKKINMFCGYRFISIPVITALVNLTTHNIEAGLTFNF